MRQLILDIINSPLALVGWSAFLATFVASVMADEQNDHAHMRELDAKFFY